MDGTATINQSDMSALVSSGELPNYKIDDHSAAGFLPLDIRVLAPLFIPIPIPR